MQDTPREGEAPAESVSPVQGDGRLGMNLALPDAALKIPEHKALEALAPPPATGDQKQEPNLRNLRFLSSTFPSVPAWLLRFIMLGRNT